MLEAVTEMLEGSYEIKVQCAKIMLDKVIEGMQSDPENQISDVIKIPLKEIKRKTPNNAPPVTINPPNQDQYPIILNDDKTIKEIQGLPFDALVELDGIKMTHQDAIGMAFQQGRIL